MSHLLGVRSDASDGFDFLLDWRQGDGGATGYAAVYHEYDPPRWSGPTGFYRLDQRRPPAHDQAKTWTPICLWADPDHYSDPTMYISFAADRNWVPPANRQYTVELLYVPNGIEGAPEVGTQWTVPLMGTLAIEVPTFKSYTGEGAYQFSFTVSAAADPPSPGARPPALGGSAPSGRSSARAADQSPGVPAKDDGEEVAPAGVDEPGDE
jgi:hypothetical protein